MKKQHIMDINKVPSHFQTTDLRGRALPLLPLIQEGSTRHWIPLPNGQFQEFIPVSIVRGSYVAAVKQAAGDTSFEFLTYLYQHATWQDVFVHVRSIESDLLSFATSLRKMELYFFARKEFGGADLFVRTELEYVLGVSRSLFDELQKAVACVWSKVTISNRNIKKKELPDSFAKVALDSSRPRTADEIAEKWGLPAALAAEYEKVALFFRAVRTVRNDIEHYGQEAPFVFDMDSGFGLMMEGTGIEKFNLNWPGDAIKNTRIGSLNWFLSQVIWQTIDACNDLVVAIAASVSMPGEVMPGLRVFLRNEHSQLLQEFHPTIIKPWQQTQSHEGSDATRLV